MPAAVGLLLVASALAHGDPARALIVHGGDPSRGVLLNRGPGLHPLAPADPSRPTVVFIHGFNPLPGQLHFVMAERFAEAVARRHGPGAYNTLDWDWNAATFEALGLRRNLDANAAQGLLLAAAIRDAGLDPSRVHLVGHSAGAIVAASAARVLADEGRPVARLTMLEPAAFYHDTIFRRLDAGSSAPVVENFYAPGPSGYGRPAWHPGVANFAVAGRTPWLGVVCPTRSAHLDMVRWYIDSVACDGGPGFAGGILAGP